ncbi:MAG: carboxyl-terminal processing protease, partial [Salibacteraceae bacterium]
GGGGIMPDNFISIDTAGASILLSRIFYSGNFYQFAFDYADKNREELVKYGNAENFVKGFSYSGKVEVAFKAYLSKKKLKIVETDYKRSFDIISARVRAGIGRNIFGDEAFFPILHEIDSTLLESISAKLN